MLQDPSGLQMELSPPNEVDWEGDWPHGPLRYSTRLKRPSEPWRPGLLRLRCLLEDHPDRDIKSLTHLLEGIQLQVLLSPLDRAVVRPVHADLVGEALLAEAQRLATFAKGPAQELGKGCGHARHPRKLAPKALQS